MAVAPGGSLPVLPDGIRGNRVKSEKIVPPLDEAMLKMGRTFMTMDTAGAYVPSAQLQAGISEVAGRIRTARKVVALTGAGISVASGIRTYRGSGGLWEDPVLLAAHQADALPGSLPVIWSVKGPLRSQVLASAPNAAHRALVELNAYMDAKDGWLAVVTQNIDGLHERAGSPNVIELHGSVVRTRCSNPRCSVPAYADSTVPDPGQPLPTCFCGSPLRPDVVLFGEPVPMARLAEQVVQEADVLLVVGTSGRVYPAAGLVGLAASSGAYCALVNAERWDNTHPALGTELIGPAEVVLPALVAAVSGAEPSPVGRGADLADAQHDRLVAMLLAQRAQARAPSPR